MVAVGYRISTLRSYHLELRWKRKSHGHTTVTEQVSPSRIRLFVAACALLMVVLIINRAHAVSFEGLSLPTVVKISNPSPFARTSILVLHKACILTRSLGNQPG